MYVRVCLSRALCVYACFLFYLYGESRWIYNKLLFEKERKTPEVHKDYRDLLLLHFSEWSQQMMQSVVGRHS